MLLRNLFTTVALAAAAIAPSFAHADCSDLNFRAETGGGRYSRVAEDLTLPIGNGGSYRLNTLSASIATNAAAGFEVWFDVFRPATAGGPGTRILSMKAQSLITTSVPIYVTVGGIQHRKYFATMTMPSNIALQLRPGETVWVSAYVRSNFTTGKSAFLIRGESRPNSPAPTRFQNASTAPWLAPTSADCDMLVFSGFKQHCPADFNKSGGSPNQTDLTLFLNAYTVRSSSADFNRDGVVNSLDLSQFLAAYNTPCTMGTPSF